VTHSGTGQTQRRFDSLALGDDDLVALSEAQRGLGVSSVRLSPNSMADSFSIHLDVHRRSIQLSRAAVAIFDRQQRNGKFATSSASFRQLGWDGYTHALSPGRTGPSLVDRVSVVVNVVGQ
jgi:hypothetical protein